MYQALYRKWRPKTFNDVCDQEHVTRTLKSQIESGRISHAYLFTGSRGTGKTSCAKILSKAVNCLNPIDGNPCNECEICRGIDDGSILDVIEIDAASNNSVDNIRDLREEVNFTPVNTKYRVYIIDEVHMLSIGAFNALLKTLEEPPAHVIFILATTEIHKLPATILSRCQRFDFKRISPEGITKRLMYVSEKENVSLTEKAANLIARIADGGMRDALSLLDRCFAIGNNIDENAVCCAAGIASTVYLFSFSEYIANSDFTSALKLISKLHNDSCDIDSLCTELTIHFRNLMVAKSIKDCESLIVCSKEDLEAYRNRASSLKLSKILNCIEILEQTSKNIKSASNKKILLEAALVKMCGASTSNSSVDLSEYDRRIEALEKTLNDIRLSGTVITPPVAPNTTPASPDPKSGDNKPLSHINNKISASDSYDTGTKASDNAENKKEVINQPFYDEKNDAKIDLVSDGPFEDWDEVLDKLRISDAPLFGIMADSTAFVRDGRLIIQSDNLTLHDFICTATHSRMLSKAVFDTVGYKMKMAVSGNGKKEEKKNPLDDLIGKVNKFNV